MPSTGFSQSPVLLMDGGLGTTLERNHHVSFDSQLTPLWSSHLLTSDSDKLFACQRSFGRIPVDIILTATYQFSIEGFAKTRSPTFPDGIAKDSIPGFLDQAVRIAASALDGGQVALSIGPYGACMIPSQEYAGVYDLDEERLRRWHRERLSLFCTIGAPRVDFLAVETIPRVDEIKILREELNKVPGLRGIPYWVSCLFPGEEGRLSDGTTIEDAAQTILDPSFGQVPWGIGINCTKLWKLDGLLRRYEAAVAKIRGDEEWPALVLYPDGTEGEVYDSETQTWKLPEGDSVSEMPWAEELEQVVRETQRRGSWRQIVVGGCCMAGPDKIAELQRRLMST